MGSRIVHSQNVDACKQYLGSKTVNLKKCADEGFTVPLFVAIPSVISRELLTNKSLRSTVVGEAMAVLNSKTFAVRSSALIEDGEKKSLAGQFLTRTDVGATALEQSIVEVLTQAKAYLKDDLDKFSLIIQEYISPDISGVIFTRNPAGTRDMVVEFGYCEGANIVGGAVKPERLFFYWNAGLNQFPASLKPLFDKIEAIKKLEKSFCFPQDIEWCIKDRTLYILQSRSITTISKAQYEGILFVESALPKNKKFYLEKTELAEIAPRPTPVTIDLLNLIYAANGPVSNVYKKYGVYYEETKFLKIIGNELFVDKEKELKGLLPGYSYFHSHNLFPTFSLFSKPFVTLKNVFFLNTITTKNSDTLFADLKNRIEDRSSGATDLDEALANLLNDYKLIFETNLLSGLATKKLTALMKREHVNFSKIMATADHFVDLAIYHVRKPDTVVGNGLELSEESPFVANDIVTHETTESVEWWNTIPDYKKNLYKNQIIEAIIYHRLRELGRWLTVKNTCVLRGALLRRANDHGFRNNRDVYFAHLENILIGNINEANCSQAKQEYGKYNSLQLPRVLTSTTHAWPSATLGVSSGVASGVLLDVEHILKKNYKGQKIILYTDVLSPNLVQYFGEVCGIVSNNGGLLSHLAILARENSLPVIVNFVTNDFIRIGDVVKIDGVTGDIFRA